jgi:hypothetical protein
MRVGMARLTVWSFLMATRTAPAHGRARVRGHVDGERRRTCTIWPVPRERPPARAVATGVHAMSYLA